jgi:uncharacterized protein YndB with AHSA1/START domain
MRSTRVFRHFAAPRAAVYRALIDPEAIARWKVPDGMTVRVEHFEARVGGAFRVSLTYDDPARGGKSGAHTDTYRGRFVELVPDEKVVEVDEFESDDPAMQGTMTIAIALADAEGGGTDLHAIHDDLPPGVSLADNETGWNMALDKLAALLR